MYIEQAPYPSTSSPAHNFHRPGAASAAPAPFYMAGAEVPAQGGRPQQAQQHQALQSQPQHRPQQYPPRDQGPRVPSTGKQPARIQTSSPPQAETSYTAYQASAGNVRPQSLYGPQELSTSVYDSPIAPHNPASMANFTSSSYPPDDPYARASPAASTQNGYGATIPPPAGNAPSAPPNQAGFQSYSTHHGAGVQQEQGAATQPYSAEAYGSASKPTHPPAPTSQAPLPPVQQQQQPRPGADMTPPPLQPGAQAMFDGREFLPSRTGHGEGASQYKAYTPSAAVPSAPGVDDGPSAPADYYRTAAY